MAKRFLETSDFSAGLNSKVNEDGLDLGEGFQTFQNVRVSKGVAEARARFARVAVCGNDNQALSFDGVADYVAAAIDTRVWALGRQFTVEGCADVTDKTAANTILYVGVTTPSIVVDTSSSKLRVRIWGSAATLTTVTSTADCPEGTTFTWQIVRDGASLTLRVDNASDGTGTMSATNVLRDPVGDLRIARDSGTVYTDVTVDYLRAFNVARANHNDRLVRFPDPKASIVICDYDMRLRTGDVVFDRSQYENHGEAFSSPS